MYFNSYSYRILFQETGKAYSLIGKGPSEEQWEEISSMLQRLQKSAQQHFELETMKAKLRQNAEPEKQDKFQQKKQKADIHILEYYLHEEQQVWKHPFPTELTV